MMLHCAGGVDGRDRRLGVEHEFIALAAMVQVVAEAADKQRETLTREEN
jgi:hypothetical protein